MSKTINQKRVFNLDHTKHKPTIEALTAKLNQAGRKTAAKKGGGKKRGVKGRKRPKSG